MKKFIKHSSFSGDNITLDYSNDRSLFTSVTYADWENESRYYISALSVYNQNVYPSFSKPSFILVSKSDSGNTPGIDDKFKQLFDSYTSGLEKIDVKPGVNPLQKIFEEQGGNVNSTITFSKPEGSWFVVFKSDYSYIRNVMKSIIEKMELALIPLIESNLLFYYSIDSSLVSNKTVYSQKGKEYLTSQTESESTQIENFKFLIELGLSKYPECKKRIDLVLNNSGFKNIKPINHKIDVSKSEFIKSIIDTTDSIDIEIYKNLIVFNDKNLKKIEQILTSANKNNINYDQLSSFFYHFIKEYDNLFDENGFIYVKKEWFYYGFTKFIDDIGEEGRFYKLKNYLSELAENAIVEGDRFTTHFMMNLYQYLNISPSVKSAYEKYEFQVNEQIRQNEQLKVKKEKENAKLIDWNTAIYDLKNDIGFTNIDNYDDISDYLIAHREDYDWTEDIALIAQDEALERIDIPKKREYGNDENEIEDDIYVYNDKFLDDINFWSTEQADELEKSINDNPDNVEEVMNTFIYNKLKKEFIEWREEQINSDIVYNEEPDLSDIYEIELEIIQSKAYENGIAYFDLDWDKRQLKIKLNKQYKKDVLALMKEVKRINKDEEGDIFSNDFIILLDYQDNGSESIYFQQI